MEPRISCAILTTACVLAMATTGIAQTYDVTFKVPLNVTRISPEITKVEVFCDILSEALPTVGRTGSVGHARAFVDLSPTGGQVVTTATVVVPVSSLNTSATPTAGTASYTCTFTGFSQPLQRWDRFSATQAVAAFRLSPTPADISGTFTW